MSASIRSIQSLHKVKLTRVSRKRHKQRYAVPSILLFPLNQHSGSVIDSDAKRFLRMQYYQANFKIFASNPTVWPAIIYQNFDIKLLDFVFLNGVMVRQFHGMSRHFGLEK